MNSGDRYQHVKKIWTAAILLIALLRVKVVRSEVECTSETGRLPHPDDCSMYLQCQDGTTTEKECPTGTVFSDLDQSCVQRLSEGDTCTSANAVRECEIGNVDLIPHPTACQRYFDCSDTSTRSVYSKFQPYENECVYPDVFDDMLMECVHYETANCTNGRVAAKWVCEYLANLCQTSHCTPCFYHNPSCIGKDDGRWPNPQKLWDKYYTTCVSERSVNGEEHCDTDEFMGMIQYFHPDKRQCLPLWEIHVDEGGYKPSCASKEPGFYPLDQIEIISYHCPGEEKFLCQPPLSYDYDLSRCTPFQEVIPTTDPFCAGKDSGLYPHPARLWSPYYFECIAERIVNGIQYCVREELMGMTQLFHPDKRLCLPLWDIPVDHSGYEPSCESKDPGFHEADNLNIVSYYCPGELKFLCRPPLSYHYNLSLCTPLQADTPGVDPLCIDKSDGLWPHPLKPWTSFYVQCQSHNVEGGEQSCQEMLGLAQLFHPQERKCVPLWDIPRDQGGFKSSCESQDPGYHSYDILAYTCPDEKKFLCRPPLYNNSQDDDVSRCDPIPSDCLHQPSYYHLDPHPDDCSKYVIQCQDGGSEEWDCPPGHVFNQQEDKCVKRFSEWDTCTSANAVRECEIGNVDLIPHPTECQLYFDCSDTSARGQFNVYLRYEKECKYPEVFDGKSMECVSYENASCANGRVVPKWVCEYKSSQCSSLHCPTCSTRNPSCIGKDDGLWPNPAKLWSPYYTTCVSERSVNGEEHCDPDEFMGMTQYFHPDKRQCLPLWEIHVDHGGYEPSCASKEPGFYPLDQIEIISYHCPGEEKFLCRPPLSVHYNLSRCTPLQADTPGVDPLCIDKADGLWPHPLKPWTSFYVQCQSHNVEGGEQSCQEMMGVGQLFHPQDRKCVPLWDIPRDRGGFKSSCESLDPGYYRYDILAYKCPDEKKFLCRPPLYYNSQDDDVSRCDPIPSDCLHQPSYYHLDQHPDDCRKYVIQCQDGGSEEWDCPPGHVFNQHEDKCVKRFSEWDTCTSANAVRECEIGNVDLIPHPTECQRYFNCSDTSARDRFNLFVLYEDECVYPFVFDESLRECVHFANASCGIGRVEAKWVCDYLRSQCPASSCRPCSIDNPSCVGKEDGLWPNPQKLWTHVYTTCKSERSTNGEETCILDELLALRKIFDPEKRQCMPVWEIPVKHGGLKPSCVSKQPGFYEADAMKIISYHCPGEEKFLCKPPLSYDYNISRCTPLQADIPNVDPLCEDKSDGLWPNPAKLWTPFYVECQSEKVKGNQKLCRDVMGVARLFHPEKRECVPLWDIPRQHGGLDSSCESKDAGYHSNSVVAFRCPGGERYLCRPPLFSHSRDDDVSRCDPIDGDRIQPPAPDNGLENQNDQNNDGPSIHDKVIGISFIMTTLMISIVSLA